MSGQLDPNATFSEAAFATFKTAAEILGAYTPIISSVATLVKEIDQIFENSECNKKICLLMVERVQTTEFAMKKMMRRKDENEKFFLSKSYYLAFLRFENILKRIKDYTLLVSNLKGYRTLISAKKIKDQYIQLTNEYDDCMKDLHFSIAIANEEERKAEAEQVEESLKEIEDTLEKIETDIKDNNNKMVTTLQKIENIDTVVQEIFNILEMAKRSKEQTKAPEIKPNELFDPSYRKITDARGSHQHIIKKIYKSFDVACKPIMDFENRQTELSILEKLSLSPNILRFYGLSKLNNVTMVLEWAEHRSLKELYCSYDIAWTRKIQMIRDICRGILFLREVNVFHHDIRCENVFITQNLDPKLGNFKYARGVDEMISINLSSELMNVVRWMAPEQIEKYKKNKSWHHTPHQRISIMKMSETFEKLALDNPINVTTSGLLTDGTIDFDGTITAKNLKIPQFNEPFLFSNFDNNMDIDLDEKHENVDTIMSLDEGIEFHQKRDHEKAWKCFDENSNLGNILANYWKGYYLYVGYFVKKDEIQANKFFKIAADGNIPDAQFRYAVSLYPEATTNEEKRKEFLDYLTLAACNRHADAAQVLGDIYLNGKLKVKPDKSLGLSYLKTAALVGNDTAAKQLKKLNENCY
ncbi:kinase-like protein [Gigaspora margarita]|uniref:Kinase-like protein n=1 Tax=Gigaspora margarita TaxID=4874 RepID=A0A8H4A986_GIGMA|nr:kinase-like protein [Gigaspora margarita]